MSSEETLRMTTLATKQHILDSAGYVYNFDRQVYFNRSAKKILSVEFIADSDEAKLEQTIRETNDSPEWRFHFNVPPSESVKRQIAIVLG
jgi:hypothetical protein